MIRPCAGLAVLSCILVTALSGCEQTSPAASSQTPPENLASRLKALEDLLPSQSHMMADVGEHFTNLWFAGRAENWPLADFYFGKRSPTSAGPSAASRYVRTVVDRIST